MNLSKIEPETEWDSLESVIFTLTMCFNSVDIEKLRGDEFHCRISIQKLGQRASPSIDVNHFDCLLKG